MSQSERVDFRGTVTRDGVGSPLVASITVEAGAVRARTDDGVMVELALSSLTLEPGGFEGDFVFCRSSSSPGGATIAVRDPAFVDALRVAGIPSLEPQLAKVTRHRAGVRRGGWISMGIIAIVMLALGALLWSTPALLAASTSALPTSIDRQLGDAAWDESSLGGPVRTDAALRGPVDEIVARLASSAEAEGHTLRVTIVESEEMNAFALPGGRIVVFTGLLREAESPEQVAGVLAHEIAHVTRRHGMRNLAHRAGIALAVQLLIGGDADGWTALATDAAVFARQNDYSREQESEADAEAVVTMSRAGLDPLALAGFFRTMQRVEGTTEGSALTSWLSTHPDHAARIAHIESLARDAPRAAPHAFTSDWSALRAALPER